MSKKAKTVARRPARTRKSKKTEVTWASEDVTRRAIEGINNRLNTIEMILTKMTEWIRLQESKKSSEVPEK